MTSKNRYRGTAAIFLSACLGVAATGWGEDKAADATAGAWPQWRGPLNTGAAAEGAKPPTEWGEQKNVKWKVKLPGSGSSTPIVWGDQIFIQTAIPAGPAAQAPQTDQDDAATALAAPPPGPPEERRGRRGRRGSQPPTTKYQFVLMCLDRNTGETKWQQTAAEELPHEGHHGDHGYSSHSPVTDGQHVWAYFGSRGLYCFDMTGKRVWEKRLGQQRTRMGFGEGSSPALHGDTIVINWDHEGDDFIVALDKRSGDERWRQPRDEPTSWTTPLIVEHESKAQVVVPGTNRVRSYDLATGEQAWECQGLTGNVIPTPVAGDGIVYVMSGFRGAALFAVKLGHEGDLTGTDAIAWSHMKDTPYVPSPVLFDGKLLFFSANRDTVTVLDAKSGKPIVDAQRLGGLESVYASPVAAGGHVYMVGRNGTTIVAKVGEGKVDEVAVNELPEGIDASPAVVGNELFLRGKQSLYCIAAK